MVSGHSGISIVRAPGDHKVTFTVMIACAVQAGSNQFMVNCHDLPHSFFARDFSHQA